MTREKIALALVALAMTAAPLVGAQAQSQWQPQWQSRWEAPQTQPRWPWQKQYTSTIPPANQAAVNGNAAIQWQATINSYAHR